MAISAAEKKRQKQIRDNIFNSSMRSTGPTKTTTKALTTEAIRSQTEAFLARGGKIKGLPSEQRPPKKRPAMQHLGNGGFGEW